jgi:NAD dependent epimerase/dehydratase family enzyme
LAPKLLLRFVLGEMSSIILNGSRISANKIKKAGFKFKFKNLEKALKNLK